MLGLDSRESFLEEQAELCLANPGDLGAVAPADRGQGRVELAWEVGTNWLVRGCVGEIGADPGSCSS